MSCCPDLLKLCLEIEHRSNGCLGFLTGEFELADDDRGYELLCVPPQRSTWHFVMTFRGTGLLVLLNKMPPIPLQFLIAMLGGELLVTSKGIKIVKPTNIFL